MPRDFRVYLEDILGAISKIRRYTDGLSKQGFAADEKTLDAVIRNLEVIGEAVKQLPADLRARQPGLDWQKIAGLRDILISPRRDPLLVSEGDRSTDDEPLNCLLEFADISRP